MPAGSVPDVGVELAPQPASAVTPAISDVKITTARKRWIDFCWIIVFIVFLLEELLVDV